MNNLIESAIKYWNNFPKEIFIPLKKKGLYKIVVIKFRECNTEKELFNDVEPYKGIRFIDLLGTNDYFIGEFIIVSAKIWEPTIATKAVVLNPKFRSKRNKITKTRDDGFIKTYKSGGSTIITLV